MKIKQKIKEFAGVVLKTKYTPIVLLIMLNAFCIHLAIPKEIIVKQDTKGFRYNNRGAWEIEINN